MEKRKGQRKDTPYGIPFFRRLSIQFAPGYAAGYGLNDGSDDRLEFLAKGLSSIESVSEQKH
jgi:hypothetical protein